MRAFSASLRVLLGASLRVLLGAVLNADNRVHGD